MGFVGIFGKSIMKNASLPKISILLQFGGEILALLCPGDSIQILLILSQFQTLGIFHHALSKYTNKPHNFKHT